MPTHARIHKFSPGGGGGGGGDVQVHLTYKKSDAIFSPQLILQKPNGYFQRKISFSQDPGWLGGDCLFPIETHITFYFSRGVRTPFRCI